MNTFRLAIAFIRRRPLQWGFNLLSLALGVAVVVALLGLDSAIDRRFERDLAGVDLVVGHKGSPLQIILSSLFQLDVPTGNVPLSVFTRLQANRLVKRAVPVSLGDNLAGYRIVGTSGDYVTLYGAHLVGGRLWSGVLEAVLGSEVAATQHLRVGDVFVGEHGLARGGERHVDNPYRVVGILAPTGAVIDRVALTGIASVWKVHEHENAEHAAAVASIHEVGEADNYPAVGQEVTAILVQYRSTMAALMLPRLFGAQANLQTAVPAVEVSRLTALLGQGAAVMRGFGIGLLLLSTLGFFVALLSAVQGRRRELALLRALGAGPGRLVALVMVEALILGGCGALLGLALGRGAGVVAARAVAVRGGPALTLPPLGQTEIIVFATAIALTLLAALLPAIIAYRLRPAEALGA